MKLSKYKAYAVGSALAVFAASAPLVSVQAQNTPAPAATNVNWNTQDLRSGISVSRLNGMDVRGQNGNSIGEVEHVLISKDGRITALVVESGGFANIGDTHFRVPFNEVKFGREMDHVIVPLTEQTAERYRDTKDERVVTKAGEYRVSNITSMGVGVSLRDGQRYGTVEDLIATRDGTIKAAIVDAAMGPGGRYATPFNAATFDFEGRAYNAPFDRNAVNNFDRFDYNAMGVREPMRGTGATGGAAGGTGGAGGNEMNQMRRQSRG